MTTKASALLSERARWLLAHEGATPADGDRCAVAAERVHDKLHAHLVPLLGSAGFRSLLARGAKVARTQHPGLAGLNDIESATRLRECLSALEPAVALEAGVALFGTFLELIATFIGERLTAEILRSEWPTIEESGPKEIKK